MYKNNDNLPWLEIFENYYSGMSQRELIKLYDIDMRTIQRTCKNIMIELVTSPGSVMRRNWDKIKIEISEAMR